MTRRSPGEGSVFYRADRDRWIGQLEAGYGAGHRGRRFVSGKTKAEAKALVAAARAVRDATGALPDARLTVRSFLDRWLDDVVRPSVRPSTFRGYSMIVRVHLAPSLGRILLARLGPADVTAYLAAARARGLSSQTVAHHRAVLRQALGTAIRWNLVARNAAAIAEPPRVERKEVRPLSLDDARRLLDAVQGDRLEALYVLALSTGMRQGELLGLTWGAVDLDAGTLVVRLALQRIGGRAELVDPKTDKSRRTVGLPDLAIAALRDHRRRQLEERLASGPGWHDQDLVFATPAGRALHGTTVTKQFQRVLEQAGIPRARFHDLRHTAATFLLARGVARHVVASMLGHKTPALVDKTYGHVLDEQTRDAVRRMSEALGG